jgi:hypothetical protein
MGGAEFLKETTMDRFKSMSDIQLRSELRCLERDVADFHARAAGVAANVERQGRVPLSDPLHRRLVSIHAFLSDRLAAAESEMRGRAASGLKRRRWPLRWMFPRGALRGERPP